MHMFRHPLSRLSMLTIWTLLLLLLLLHSDHDDGSRFIIDRFNVVVYGGTSA